MSTRRTPLRLRKAFDRYEINSGSAGFVQIIRNGKRITPKNTTLQFNVRRGK